jgi:hypothetical protein
MWDCHGAVAADIGLLGCESCDVESLDEWLVTCQRIVVHSLWFNGPRIAWPWGQRHHEPLKHQKPLILWHIITLRHSVMCHMSQRQPYDTVSCVTVSHVTASTLWHSVMCHSVTASTLWHSVMCHMSQRQPYDTVSCHILVDLNPQQHHREDLISHSLLDVSVGLFAHLVWVSVLRSAYAVHVAWAAS